MPKKVEEEVRQEGEKSCSDRKEGRGVKGLMEGNKEGSREGKWTQQHHVFFRGVHQK